MRKNFICIYCKEIHPSEFTVCPATDTPISPAHKLTSTHLDGKYAINNVIGEGGMGVIYEAEQVDTGQRVAIKFLNPAISRSKESYERFQREARAATLIDHHNIVQIFDIGSTENGIPYIVMEHLFGEDLGKRIESCITFPMDGAIDILSQILETLESVHAKGIVHRDLKPENVFLVKHRDIGEFVKILDFGIARLTTPQQQSARLTTSGHIFGTPYYISPEQAEGEMDVDHRSDLYSAGVIFYELLTGHLPFWGRAFGKILLEIMTRPVPDPRQYVSGLNRAVSDFIFTSLAKDPDQRYRSANEMLKDLRGLDLSDAARISASAGRIKTKPETPVSEQKKTIPLQDSTEKTGGDKNTLEIHSETARRPVMTLLKKLRRLEHTK